MDDWVSEIVCVYERKAKNFKTNDCRKWEKKTFLYNISLRHKVLTQENWKKKKTQEKDDFFFFCFITCRQQIKAEGEGIYWHI